MMTKAMIDTPKALRDYLDSLALSDRTEPLIYVDLEGNDLSRNGSLSLVTILDPREGSTTTLIDVKALGSETFTTTNTSGQSLKKIFESKDIVKVFFDIRNDSDALYSLYDVKVQGIEDLQLMELASRSRSRRCVNGLAKCIEYDALSSVADLRKWRIIKEKGQRLFRPDQGGSFAVFDARPLHPDIQEYCIQDVALMPHLRDIYRGKLCDAWWRKIKDETEARIRLSQSPNFNGQGRHMALGPSAWQYWNPSAAQKRERTFLEPKKPTTSEPAKPNPAPSSSSPSPSKSSIDALAKAMKQAKLEVSSDDESFDGGDSHYDEYRYNSDDYHGDSGLDFAACDKECGYCGKCPY